MVLASAILGLLSGPAGAQEAAPPRFEIEQGCAPFSHIQTYRTWGPALAYNGPVTVAYEASRCTASAGRQARVDIRGTATVYRGTLVEGTPIDSRPFTVAGTWSQPTDPQGWPPDWWRCSVQQAQYTWDIAGIYTFDVAARGGVWSLRISTQGPEPRLFTWSYDGCA